ncbi:MAG: hypothetical protein UU70_C0009G0002 [Candidatus Yanofskybacteria bacterium GW2011_GWA1_41_6]|uniref:Uncharacterized protein n=1 Tax=Candidatus Yanofskybacteria bacterium GW2011_GWA1_41_6 TaxID=1619020 RepID=A0A0G0WNV3_9BACT|nr:MAG: hypothetical protein UU70_C0009G0002 [Candidatus Yanofskybacteria bacterium GW2011_GWA1_41_6]
MIASTHLAVGAAAGLAIQRCLSLDTSDPEKLFWSFAAGFASHLVLDALPHKEYSINGVRLWPVLLLEIGIVFALVLSSKNSLPLNLLLFLGMAGGALPDVIELVYDYMFKWPWLNNLGRVIHLSHYGSQNYAGYVFNFYFQIILALLSVVFVRIKPAS